MTTRFSRLCIALLALVAASSPVHAIVITGTFTGRGFAEGIPDLEGSGTVTFDSDFSPSNIFLENEDGIIYSRERVVLTLDVLGQHLVFDSTMASLLPTVFISDIGTLQSITLSASTSWNSLAWLSVTSPGGSLFRNLDLSTLNPMPTLIPDSRLEFPFNEHAGLLVLDTLTFTKGPVSAVTEPSSAGLIIGGLLLLLAQAGSLKRQTALVRSA